MSPDQQSKRTPSESTIPYSALDRLNLGEKTSAEKLLPLRRCVKGQRFLSDFYYYKFIDIYELNQKENHRLYL